MFVFVLIASMQAMYCVFGDSALSFNVVLQEKKKKIVNWGNSRSSTSCFFFLDHHNRVMLNSLNSTYFEFIARKTEGLPQKKIQNKLNLLRLISIIGLLSPMRNISKRVSIQHELVLFFYGIFFLPKCFYTCDFSLHILFRCSIE